MVSLGPWPSAFASRAGPGGHFAQSAHVHRSLEAARVTVATVWGPEACPGSHSEQQVGDLSLASPTCV